MMERSSALRYVFITGADARYSDLSLLYEYAPSSFGPPLPATTRRSTGSGRWAAIPSN
ncbi:MAG: hypothetical protein R2751_18915 [Bacteroidales bacterium]